MKRLTIILTLLLGGCSVHNINSYDLGTSSIVTAPSRYEYKVLKVEFPSALDALGSSRIYYKRDGITSYYLYSSWEQSLNRLIYSKLIKSLESSGSFKSVVGYSSYAKADLVLETQILDFYHIVKGDESYADIKFSVKLIDESSGKILKDKIYSYNIKVKELNAKGFITAAQKAVNMFLEDLSSSLF